MTLLWLYRTLSRFTGPWLPEEVHPPPPGALWFHGASAGEVASLAPLIRLFHERTPFPLFLTVVTATGLRVAQGALPELTGQKLVLSRFPYDHPGWIRTFFRQNPRALLIAEAELWPNLLLEAHRRRIPVYLVNARLSERTLRKMKALGGFYPALLRIPRRILTQSERHRERFLRLGMLPERVEAVGNLKFDTIERPFRPLDREELGLPSEGPLLVWGSLREGEEVWAVRLILRLRRRIPEASFILAPRHRREVERTLGALEARNIPHHQRSRGGRSPVLVLDTMGELWSLYHIADVAVVGGTFTPFGGHSPLEPAFCSLPVILGPHTWAIEELAEGLIRSRGGFQVRSPEELEETAELLLRDQRRRMAVGSRARAFAEKGRGVAERLYRIVSPDLTESKGA